MKIRTKLLLTLLPLGVVSIGVMTEVSRRVVEHLLAEEVAKRGISVVRDAADDSACVAAFQGKREELLLPFLHRVLERTGGDFAVAIATDGSVLAHTNVTEVGRIHDDGRTRDALRSEHATHRRGVLGGREIVDVSIPVWAVESDPGEAFLTLDSRHRTRLGVMRLGIPLHEAFATSDRISRQVFMTITLVGGLTLVLILLVLRRLLAPVPSLVEAARRLGGGSLGETVPVRSGDEIGELAASFNRMSRDLAQTTVSREFLDSILTNMQNPLVVLDPHGRIMLANASLSRLAGYEEAALLGRPVSILLGEDLSGLPLDERDPGSSIQGQDGSLLTQDGRRISVLLGVSTFTSRDGALEGYVLTATDITAREQAEAELRHSLSLLRATLESTADGILVVDGQGRIITANHRFAELWRIPEELMEARDDQRALGYVLDQLEDPPQFLAKVQELYSQPEAESYDILTFRDGRVFERYSKPQRMEGRSVGRVWSFRDVTERRKAEAMVRERDEQLRQVQKLEAIGTLAGGVAHDFNNILTAITGYTQLLQGRLAGQDLGRRELAEIEKAAARASSLTRQLLAFSRKQVLQPKVIELNAVVADMERMLKRLIGEDIELVAVPGASASTIEADPGQIEQVIMNLVVNARDAMPHGGVLTLETALVDLDERQAGRGDKARPGRHVMLAVSDTGLGMDKETQARVYEPFFTTKPPGKGTGLGLSTVYGIVQQSGGAIWLYSEPGSGTTFKVFLPFCAAQGADAAPRPAAGAFPIGAGTILLVEDDEVVRRLAAEVLVTNGFRVLEAGDGVEALRLIGTRTIDLLITDVIMPRMGGGELAREFLAKRPAAKVLYISGYTDDMIVRRGILDGGMPFLQKPFTLQALLGKVHELFRGESGARAA